MGFPSRLLRAIMMDCNGAYKRAFGVPFVGQRWTRTTRGESTGNDHYHYTQFCREIIIELVLPRLPRVLHTATSSRTTKRKSIRANSKHTKRSSSDGFPLLELQDHLASIMMDVSIVVENEPIRCCPRDCPGVFTLGSRSSIKNTCWLVGRGKLWFG